MTQAPPRLHPHLLPLLCVCLPCRGAIRKKGDWTGMWNQRYLRLFESGELVNYTTEKDSAASATPRRVWTLAGSKCVSLDGTTFKLQLKDAMAITLRTSSEREKRQWVEAIEDVVGFQHPGLIVIDEAHHLWPLPRWEAARGALPTSSPWLLLTDDSQTHEQDIPFPPLGAVRLTEVVRCSPRIMLAASDYAFRSNQDSSIVSVHESAGPPLKATFFQMQGERFECYAKHISNAVWQLAERFPGLVLDDRVAILVPDEQFAAAVRPKLEAALASHFAAKGRRVALVDAEEASARLFGALQMPGRKATDERLVLAPIDAFDGLERLFVIAAAMDGSNVSVEVKRSRVYRAISRAHMHVTLVEEERSGGMLAWLQDVQLGGEFDSEHERERRKVGAAEAAIEEAQQALMMIKRLDDSN